MAEPEVSEGFKRMCISVEYTVMLLNQGTGSGQDRTSVAERRRVSELVIKNEIPSLLFCQEIQAPKKRLWKMKIQPYDSKSTEAEAGILWDTEKFTFLEELGSDLKSPICESAEISSRTCVVALQLKSKPRKCIIAISWHGPSTMSTVNKIKLYGHLQTFAVKAGKKMIDIIRKNHPKIEGPLPILIGGDFNLDMVYGKKHLIDTFDVALYENKGRTEDGKEKIDYFIHTNDVNIEGLMTLDIDPSMLTKSKGDKEKLMKSPLDHDIIMGTISWEPERES